MKLTICIASSLVLMAGAALAASTTGSFEDELDIVDQSYFVERGYFQEEPQPRTVTLGKASWAPFSLQTGFNSVHLMSEQACRIFLRNLRQEGDTACMNVHTGRIFYREAFIGPMMP